MPTPECLLPWMKVNHIKYGDARVFGEDAAERRRLDDSAAVQRFDELWETTLCPEMEEHGHELTKEEAEEMLEEKFRPFAIAGYKFLQFSLEHVPFIARITAGEHCDQLWALGRHRDPTRLCVHFSSTEDRQRFESIAKQLGWESKNLGLRLLTDFMQKFNVIGDRPIRPN